MVRCVVKSCRNKPETCKREEVSFFILPKNDVIREGWLQKIGEFCLPFTKTAKICSIHFTKESFHVGKRQKAGKCLNSKRLLLPTAFPTLMLSPRENRNNTVRPDFKIIRTEFLLTANRSTDEGSSSNENPVSNENLDLNISDTITNIETPKSHGQRKLWVNERLFEAVENTSDVLDKECSATFPRRSERVERSHRRNKSLLKTKMKRQVTASVLKKLKMPRKLFGEYHSEEDIPLSIRKRRFEMENYTNTVSTRNYRENEEPHTSMKLLKAELEHHRSVNQFHLESRCNDIVQVQEIKIQCESLQSELIQKNKEIQDLLEEREHMQKTISDLSMKVVAADLDKRDIDNKVEDKVKEILQRYFTEGQIRCIIENRKWIRWSIDDYASAISFRSVSAKAYRYFRLKLNYPLPSLSSLRRWALNRFDIREGFLFDVLTVMREKGKTLTSFEKVTVLTFDEMSVSSEVQFDLKIEKLVGSCGKVQVIMARGLFGNWKQPIYYKFDQPMTKDILMEAVCRLYKVGYEVVATTSDMGNKGVWKELQITPDNHFFDHPVLKGGQIFVFADVPHLLKLLRNWFVDDGFSIEHCKNPFTAEIMQAIINMGNSSDVRVAHRLTQQLLDARHSMRQAVKPAARIWSHTVAKAIKWAGESGILNVPDYEKFSDFVLTVNNWFDVHNSQQKYGSHPGVNGFGTNINNQEMILILMNLYIQNMRVGTRKSMMPFQKGILISNASLRRLYDYLKRKYQQEFEYILTRRLQQDVLENFFAYIRAMGSCTDHPSGYDFRYRLRWYILGKHSHAVFSMNRNSEEDVNTSCMSSSFAGESSSILSDIPSTSKPVASTPKCQSTGEPSSENICESSDIILNNHSLSEIQDHSQDEIILTKEIFSNIINISPEQLQEDSACNNDADLEENMDDDDDDLFRYIENPDCPELCTLYSENASSNIVQEAGLKYVAGYVAHRFKKKYPHLGQLTSIDDSTSVNWRGDDAQDRKVHGVHL